MTRLLILMVSLLMTSQTAFSQTLATPENLVVENVPPIPSDLPDAVNRYTESRAASFVDWHPVKKEMLISTRFGNTNQLHFVTQPLGARTQLTFFNEPVGGATFEPNDGSYFVFSKDIGGNEFAQLFRFDLETHNVTLLSDGGRSQNGRFLWNKSKTKAIYSSTRRNGTDRDLWLIDPMHPDQQELLLELPGGGWSATDWSPDDSRLLLVEYLSITSSKIWMVDVQAKTKTLITNNQEEVAWGAAEFNPLNPNQIFVTTDEGSEFQRLAILDLEDSKLTILTDVIPWDVDSFAISKDGSKLAFLTNEAGIAKLYIMNTANKSFYEAQGLPPGIISGLSWHNNNVDLALTYTSAKSSSDAYSFDTNSLQFTRWTASELGGMNLENLRDAELVTWKSFDDLSITGFLYRPAPKFTGKRPVLILIHGGPESQARPGFMGRYNYLLNELGIAIIQPNVRGSAGYGKSFVKLDNVFLREDSVKDIGALFDWIDTQPDLDSQRIMVMGGSYGGYMTLAVSTNYPERFRCSVDIVGISHFGTFLKNTEDYRRDLRRAEYGDERDPDVAAFFEKISPLNNAAKIKNPLFIIQGKNDPRVPLSEAEQMFEKLKAQGTPVWYLMAKDEGHGFRKKSNADYQFYATILFMQQFLLN